MIIPPPSQSSKEGPADSFGSPWIDWTPEDGTKSDHKWCLQEHLGRNCNWQMYKTSPWEPSLSMRSDQCRPAAANFGTPLTIHMQMLPFVTIQTGTMRPVPLPWKAVSADWKNTAVPRSIYCSCRPKGHMGGSFHNCTSRGGIRSSSHALKHAWILQGVQPVGCIPFLYL